MTELPPGNCSWVIGYQIISDAKATSAKRQAINTVFLWAFSQFSQQSNMAKISAAGSKAAMAPLLRVTIRPMIVSRKRMMVIVVGSIFLGVSFKFVRFSANSAIVENIAKIRKEPAEFPVVKKLRTSFEYRLCSKSMWLNEPDAMPICSSVAFGFISYSLIIILFSQKNWQRP